MSGFTKFPNAIIRAPIPAHVKVVFGVIASYFPGGTVGPAFPSFSCIAQLAHMSRTTVKLAINVLVDDLKVLSINPRGNHRRSHKYWLNAEEVWRLPGPADDPGQQATQEHEGPHLGPSDAPPLGQATPPIKTYRIKTKDQERSAHSSMGKRHIRKQKGLPSKFDLDLGGRWLEHARSLSPNTSAAVEAYAESIRRLRMIDGYDEARLEAVFSFASKHQFWGDKVLSPASLRKKRPDGLSKIDQITAQMTKQAMFPAKTVSQPEAPTRPVIKEEDDLGY